MLRTSRPCAVTTSGASTREAKSPAGTRKWPYTTSGRKSRATRAVSRASSRKRRLPPPRRSSTARASSWPRAASACSSPWTKTPRSGSSGPGYICETRRIRTAPLCHEAPDRFGTLGTASGAASVVGAPLLAQNAAELADGALRAERPAQRLEEILGPARGRARPLLRRGGRPGVAPRAHPCGALELAPLPLGVDPQELDPLLLGLLEAVDADDHALARLDLARVAERGLLDLALDEPRLDRRHRAAELVDARDQLLRARLQLVGQRLDGVGPAERVGDVRAAGLVREDLLRPQSDARGALRGQRECLVEAVRVERLRPAHHRGERLDRDAHGVVLRLLRGQRRAAGLRVEAQ